MSDESKDQDQKQQEQDTPAETKKKPVVVDPSKTFQGPGVEKRG